MSQTVLSITTLIILVILVLNETYLSSKIHSSSQTCNNTIQSREMEDYLHCIYA